MSSKATRATILAIALTDATFERADGRDGPVWVGKCIHCRTRLTIGPDGRPLDTTTIEHIVPRNHGGTDELPNLALACARCNHGKGARLDRRRSDDPTLAAVIARLQEERRRRWRAPPDRA